MRFLPAENIVYKTNLKEDEVIKQLSGCVEPGSIMLNFLLWLSDKPYEGHIDGRNFKIRKVITNGNPFCPRISGIIYNDFDDLKISVKMRLPVVAIAFLCICCVFIVVFTFIVLLMSAFNPVAFIPSFVVLFLLYVITLVCFNFGSEKAKKNLAEIFQAKIIEE
ncbi:MAG: hypothetical protein FWH36_00775 [Lentimicrobiaceae bacterium]|nr:hypothetical protein [Lentimicrobiaceae bacterium]